MVAIFLLHVVCEVRQSGAVRGCRGLCHTRRYSVKSSLRLQHIRLVPHRLTTLTAIDMLHNQYLKLLTEINKTLFAYCTEIAIS